MQTETYHISDAVVAPDCSITSGATIGQVINAHVQHLLRMYLRTPVRAPHHRVVSHCACRRAARDAEVRELDAPVLVRQDVRALDIAMDDTLVVQVHQAFEHLRDVYADQGFRELAKALAYVV